jgi:hypothetical protein
VLFFATGARTPLLALLALRRPRNLAAVLVPYAGLGLFAFVIGDPAAMLLAFAPAPLLGPRLARAIGAREETVGALLTGTIVVSFPLLVAVIPGIASSVNFGLFAFVLGAALGGWVPRIRDAFLPALDAAKYLAVASILGVTFVMSPSIFDLRTFGVAAAALVVGAVCAAAVARVFGGERLDMTIGGGLRDGSVAAGLAVGSGLAGAGSVPVAYVVLLVLAAALRQFFVRGHA